MDRNNVENWFRNLLQALPEFLQGQYYVTVYHQYSREHSRMFHAARVKRCLYYGFYIALLYQIIEATFFHQDEDEMHETLKIVQGQAAKKEKGTGGLPEGLLHTSKPTSSRYSFGWTLSMLYGFLFKYILVTLCLYLALYVIPALYSIAYSVFVRHDFGRRRYRPVNGLFRFHRVRSRRH